MSISEFYERSYFDYQVSYNKKGDVDSIKLESSLLQESAAVAQNVVYTWYYQLCAADIMNVGTGQRSSKHKSKIQDQPKFPKPSFFGESRIEDNFADLPPYSWFLTLHIQLEEPFLSSGDEPFYVVDNSVCRDGGSGLPMIKSTTWKGHFLDAAYNWQPGLERDYFSNFASWSWQEQTERMLFSILEPLDGEKKQKAEKRVCRILERHGGLEKCPLRAIEELYRIAAGGRDKKQEKEWLKLYNKACSNEQDRSRYNRHALTILHQLRGAIVGILNRLCGSDDELYSDEESGGRRGRKRLHRPPQEKVPAGQAPQAGRLSFFPSYFTALGYDVLAPVDRKTRTVTNPIPVEMIPKGSESEFHLFYLARPLATAAEAMKDLSLCCEIFRLMLGKSGFSAKKGVGYGQARIKGGECVIHRKDDSDLLALENKWRPPDKAGPLCRFGLDTQSHSLDKFLSEISSIWRKP